MDELFGVAHTNTKEHPEDSPVEKEEEIRIEKAV
jgi:hypothetical protein